MCFKDDCLLNLSVFFSRVDSYGGGGALDRLKLSLHRRCEARSSHSSSS